MAPARGVTRRRPARGHHVARQHGEENAGEVTKSCIHLSLPLKKEDRTGADERDNPNGKFLIQSV